ncbi:hypothetical protein IAR50_003209 [Cryptococcus sp. DSM 104548]
MAPTQKPGSQYDQSSDSDISSVEDGDAYESPAEDDEDPDQEYNVDAIMYAYSIREDKKRKGRKSQAVKDEEAKPQWHYGVMWKGYLKTLSDMPQPVDSFEGPDPPVIKRFWAGMGMTPSDGSLEPLDKAGDRYDLPPRAMKQWLDEEPTRSWKLYKKRAQLERIHEQRVDRGQVTGPFRCPKRYSDHYHWLKFKKRSEQAMAKKVGGKRSKALISGSSDDSSSSENDDGVPLKATKPTKKKRNTTGSSKTGAGDPKPKTDKQPSKKKRVMTTSSDSDSSANEPLSARKKKAGKANGAGVVGKDMGSSKKRKKEIADGRQASEKKSTSAKSDDGKGDKTRDTDSVEFGELDRGIFDEPAPGAPQHFSSSAPPSSKASETAAERPEVPARTDNPPSSKPDKPVPPTASAKAPLSDKSPSSSSDTSSAAPAKSPQNAPGSAPSVKGPAKLAGTDKPPSSKGSVPPPGTSAASAAMAKDPSFAKFILTSTKPPSSTAQAKPQQQTSSTTPPAPVTAKPAVFAETDKGPSSKGRVPDKQPPSLASPPPSSSTDPLSSATLAKTPRHTPNTVQHSAAASASAVGDDPPSPRESIPSQNSLQSAAASTASANAPSSSTAPAKTPAPTQKKVQESYFPGKSHNTINKETLPASSTAHQAQQPVKGWLKTMKIAKKTPAQADPANSVPKPAQLSRAVLSTSGAVPYKPDGIAPDSVTPSAGPPAHSSPLALPDRNSAEPGLASLRTSEQPVRSSSFSQAASESPVASSNPIGPTNRHRSSFPGHIDLTSSPKTQTSPLPTPGASQTAFGPDGKERKKYEQPKRIKHLNDDDEAMTPQEVRRRRMAGDNDASPGSTNKSQSNSFFYTSRTTQKKKDTELVVSTARLPMGHTSAEQQRPGVAQRKASGGSPAQRSRLGSSASSVTASMSPPPVPRGKTSLDRTRDGSGSISTRDGTYSLPVDKAGKPLVAMSRQGSTDQPKAPAVAYQPRATKTQPPPESLPQKSVVQPVAPSDPRRSDSSSRALSQPQQPQRPAPSAAAAPRHSFQNQQGPGRQQDSSHLGLSLNKFLSTIDLSSVPTPTTALPPIPIDNSPQTLLTLQRLRSDSKLPDGPELSASGQPIPLASAANVDPSLCPVQSMNVIPENVVTLSPYLLLKQPKMWMKVMEALRETRRWGAYLIPSVLCFLKQTWDSRDYDLSPDPTKSFCALIKSLPLDGGHTFYTGAPWGQAYGLSVSCNPPLEKLKRSLMEWRLWLTDVARQSDFEGLVSKCIGVEPGHFEALNGGDAGQVSSATEPVDREDVILNQLRDLTAMKTNDELVYTRYVYLGQFEMGEANKKKVERSYSHGIEFMNPEDFIAMLGDEKIQASAS